MLTRLKELRKKTRVRINYSVCKAYEKMTVLKMGFIFSLCPLPELERGGKRQRESIPNEQPRGDAAAPRC